MALRVGSEGICLDWAWLVWEARSKRVKSLTTLAAARTGIHTIGLYFVFLYQLSRPPPGPLWSCAELRAAHMWPSSCVHLCFPIITTNDSQCLFFSDDVEIIGVITHKWKPFLPTVRCEAELVLVANNVQVHSVEFILFCSPISDC